MDEINLKSIQISSEELIRGHGITDIGYKIYSPPKASWRCELHPSTYWHVQEGKQPNAFHRFMQRLCFGIKWSKIDD